MDDLIAFLRARLDDLEQDVCGSQAVGDPWPIDLDVVLAEVDAKRQHLDWLLKLRENAQQHPRAEAYIFAVGLAERGIKFLALSFAGHPDYREEWRP